ncbi:MAG: DUF2325 domain-containing protein [Xylophilus ampelinus]
MRAYAEAQARCSRLLASQAREIARLESEAVRLRGALVRRDTALGLLREELALLEAQAPDRVRAAGLARLVAQQRERIAQLEQACRRARPAPPPSATPARPPMPGPRPGSVLRLDASDLDRLGSALADGAQDAAAASGLAAWEASLVAADLVVCQAGCASHGAYWRVQDHCRRTGTPCVLVDRPDALDVVRVHRAARNAPDGGGPGEGAEAAAGGPPGSALDPAPQERPRDDAPAGSRG